MQAQELIEQAEKITGTAAELARQLKVSFQEVSNWRHGRRTCPPDMRARMAEIAGMDPLAEAVEALAEGLSEERRDGFLAALRRAASTGAETRIFPQRHRAPPAHLP